MNCPDCGGKLVRAEVVGLDTSYRCETCGGIRVQGWVINKIAEDGKLMIEPRGGSAALNSAGGKMPVCPEDSVVMSGQSGEELPPELPMWKCGRCNWWWLPGDTIFELKAAYDAKREYAVRWKKPSPFKTFALPVIMMLLLMVGIGTGLDAISRRNKLASQAFGIEQLNVIYKGGGRAELRFVSRIKVGTIIYRLRDEDRWEMASVVQQGGTSVAEILGVSPGDSLWVSIGTEVRKVTVGERN